MVVDCGALMAVFWSQKYATDSEFIFEDSHFGNGGDGVVGSGWGRDISWPELMGMIIRGCERG
jgi:hypothetical protein